MSKLNPATYLKALVALVGAAGASAWAAEGVGIRTAVSALVTAFVTYLVRNQPTTG